MPMLLLALGLVLAQPPQADPPSYARDVRPLLREQCAGCHRPGKHKGKLDLTTYASLMAGGKHGAAIVPGDAGASLLVAKVRGPEPEMPSEGEPLTQAQIGLLAAWIAAGAGDDSSPGESTLTAPAVYRTAPSVTALAYSPDGHWLAVSAYHEVILHHADGAGPGMRLVGGVPRIEAIAFSPDGTRLAAVGGTPGESGQLQIWDVATGRLRSSHDYGGDTLYGVSFSPDGARVAFGGADNTARVVEVDSGRTLLEFRSHADWVLGTAFTLDGKRLVTAGRDKAMKLVDLAAGRFVDDINNPLEQVLGFARHPTADVVVCGGELGTARIYKVSDNQKRTAARTDTNLVRAFETQPGRIYAAAFAPDGKAIAVGGTGPEVRVYDATSGKRIATCKGHQGAVFALAFHPDSGQLCCAGDDGVIRTFDAATGELLHETASAPLADDATSAEPALITALTVEPSRLVLHDGRDERTVLVFGTTPAGGRLDLTDQATLTPLDDGVCLEDGRWIGPRHEGLSSVRVTAAGLVATVPVEVRSAAVPPVHFARDVMPVLARAGCNAGTCHGAQAGKNGFALSLRGFDPEADYHALVDELAGRRVDRVTPSRSLMLRKPTGEVPHEGRQVFEVGSRPYRVLLEWIREGTGYVRDDASRVTRLQAHPAVVHIVDPGQRQRVLVTAHYADGSSRDVTREAILSTDNREVAVFENGVVTAMRRGEAAVLVRYEGAYQAAPITVMGDRTGFAFGEHAQNGFIDELVHQKLRRIAARPSALCTDAEFMRRIWLDLCGTPPEPDQARAWLADATPSAEKRQRLIDELIGSPAYVERWANKWADLLQCSSATLGPTGLRLFRQWITQSVADNKPYDRFVRELITARGRTAQNPPANYLRALCEKGRTPDTGKMTEDVTQTFLGVRFSCAKCHNHPFERWTQDQYYEVSAFFARVRLKGDPLAGEMVVYDSYDGGETSHPRTGRRVPPAVPFAETDPARVDDDRRAAFAAWLTGADNPLFATSYVNRVWSWFFGRGIIEPADDIRAGNPPSNPELLDALTRDFVVHGFDFDRLVRTICSARTYQMSFRSDRWNDDDRVSFSHWIPHRLSAEALHDAIAIATGSRRAIAGLPDGARAVEAVDGIVEGDDLLALFGRPKRDSACECARTNNLSLAHALHLVTGSTLHEAIHDPDGRAARLVAEHADDARVIEELYLAAFCRLPTDAERAVVVLGSDPAQRRESAEDLLWALLNSPAFLFQR